MAYTKTTDFASKDSLLTGDPAKVVKGSEIDAEFDNIEAAIGTTTGSGAVVLATSPTLVTPVLGTPASGTVTNLTGTASININGTVGATTPASGAFTTLTTTGNVTLGDASGDSLTINASTVVCANGLNFDSNTFVIDATNNRVGIGVSPTYTVDASYATGTTTVGDGTVARFASSTTNGDVNIRFGSGSNSSVRIGANGTAFYVYTNGAERLRADAEGNILNTSTGGLGYGTGSGGTVTQGTSRTTGVTLNKTNGAITLVSAAGSASWQSFTLTNSTIAATDVVIVNQKSGTDLYQIHVTAVAAGSCKITFATTGGTTTEQPVFNFAVIKGVTS